MAIRGIIFDMDGTITVPYLDFAKIRAEIGVAEGDLIEHMAQAAPAERERIRLVLARFEADGVANAKLNPGARTLLRFLARHRIRTGLVTRNTRRSVDGVCRKLGLKFDLTLSREEAPHKPAPDAVWEIGRRWGLPRKELLVVGDYKWDLLSAKNAGVGSVLLVNGAGVPEWANLADFVIRRLTELIPIVEGRES